MNSRYVPLPSGGSRVLAIVAALLCILSFQPPGALANNGVNTPPINGVDADQIRANAQWSMYDYHGDIAATPDCYPDVNYGFDGGEDVYTWYDEGNDVLWFAIELYGNPGDADGDGGYSTISTNCSGRPDCVGIEDDGGNVFAAGIEAIRLHVDRDNSGVRDLTFELTGGPVQAGVPHDHVVVTLDGFTGFYGDVLGARGEAWEGAPIQPADDITTYGECIDVHAGVVVLRIPEWSRYFDESAGLLPLAFVWSVELLNGADSYGNDVVESMLDLTNPEIDVTIGASDYYLLADGDTTRVTASVTDMGNTSLHNVTLQVTLPDGLSFDGGFEDDPIHPIGPPFVSNGLTWSPFELARGEWVRISFRAVRTTCSESLGLTGMATGDHSALGSEIQAGDFASTTLLCSSAGAVGANPLEAPRLIVSPNPVQGERVRITYSVPPQWAGGPAELAIYDVAGRRVRTLVTDARTPGNRTATWNLRNAGGDPVVSGVYLLELRTGNESHTRKLMVVR
jgi:hypothetical protein